MTAFILPLGESTPGPGRTLRISETFTSIQGEGKLTGVPSFFIRLSGCNLRCAWCDTPYASWSPEGEPRAVDSIVREAANSGVTHAVVTGGEPLMFPLVEDLCEGLRGARMHVTIETAGTLAPRVACDLMSISPKLSNSTPAAGDPRDPTGTWRTRHEERRINLQSLQHLIDAHPSRQLKFVVAAYRDLAEIEALLDALNGWTSDDILLMPEGVTPPTPQAKAMLVRACLERNWRYCPRLHIELFGNTRGT